MDLVFRCLRYQNGQVGVRKTGVQLSPLSRKHRNKVVWITKKNIFCILEGLGIEGLIWNCHRPLWLMRCHWPENKRHWLEIQYLSGQGPHWQGYFSGIAHEILGLYPFPGIGWARNSRVSRETEPM